MEGIVQPRVLKGFRDFLPETEIPRRKLIRSLEGHFASFGYVPIDTPALEYAEVLLSKGGGETDKQTYGFTDRGGRNVALRFDLTVPFARFVAAHRGEIAMPFRRYHIGKAWRGENTQRGRYREFIQCDFDIIGTESAAADLEIIVMMAEGLKAIGAGESRIRFSHRGMFNLLLGELKIEAAAGEILRTVDKIGKIGREEVRRLLSELAGSKAAEILLDFITPGDGCRDTLEKMLGLTGGRESPPSLRIRSILDALDEIAVPGEIELDPSITRGLDYYTGIVFETYLTELPGLGSICSGGRYDNLTGLFMKDAVSGVGASIGLDRLMAGLDELGRLESRSSATDILVMMLDEGLLPLYQTCAAGLRSGGLSAEVYPEARKLTAQFKYAESQGIPLALIVGPEEAKTGTVNLKDLRRRENYSALEFSAAREKAIALLEL